MKTLRLLLITSLLLSSKLCISQSTISINDTLSSFSVDSTSQNSVISYTVTLANNSPVFSYTDNITLLVFNDSSGNGGFNTIFQLDSLYFQGQTISPSNTFTITDSLIISPSGFRNGINTVVIWPRTSATSGFTSTDTLRHNIFVSNPLNTKTKIKTGQLIIYPNPFSSKLWFYGLDKNKSEQVRVLDVIGKEILSTFIQNNEALDLSILAKGVYFIYIKSSGGTTTIIKTIKE